MGSGGDVNGGDVNGGDLGGGQRNRDARDIGAPATGDHDRDLVVAELAMLRAGLTGADGADAALRLAALRIPDRPGGLDEVATGFGLTPFERAVLLLAAGPELVAATAGELLRRTGAPRLTFGAALEVLPEPHWTAITPPAPLRRWELLRLLEPHSPTTSPLVVDERILHHLLGAGHLDELVADLSRPVAGVERLPPTLEAAAEAVTNRWLADDRVLLHGVQPANVWAVAAAAARSARLRLMRISAADLTRPDPRERARLLRRLERETVLGGCAWAIDARSLTPTEAGGGAGALVELVAALDAPVILIAEADDGGNRAGCTAIAVPRVGVGERAELLAAAIRPHTVKLRGGGVRARTGARADIGDPDEQPDDERALTQEARRVSAVFDLAVDALTGVADDVAAGQQLWQACRTRSRAGFGRLAVVRAPRAGWDDLVLPTGQLRQLQALAAAVRHRHRVLQDWGFAARSGRTLGTTALFAGPSGTGKTLAAEVIAADLGLDLVQIDLSQVVSKYIGESEKHLGRLFDAAEGGGAVLLFDEADALFGKRSEVRDSHDRYANLEVGYLLQRMEDFRGLAILTTNARSSLDQAFNRRLSTIVTFPYPDAALREALWRQVFPKATPTGDIDPRSLSGIDLPGGGIAATALTAAYLAAAEGAAVATRHITEAARWELAKSGRTLAGPSRPLQRAVETG